MTTLDQTDPGFEVVSATAEHEKLQPIQERSQVIGEFFEWVENTKGAFLATYEDGHAFPVPARWPIRDLLAEFFDIDQNRLETEKRRMLDQLRAANEQRRA